MKVARFLEGRVCRNGQLGRIRDQFSEFEGLFARGVDNLALRRGAGRGIHLQPRRGRCDQHLPHGRARRAQHFPAAGQTGTDARFELFEIRSGQGLHQFDPRPIGSQLVGQDHGQRCPNPLAHFGFSDRQRHRPIRIHPDPSVRLELFRAFFFFRAKQSAPVKGDNERRSPERGGFEKGAARRAHGFFFGFVLAAPAARRMALRIRG